MKNRYRLFVRGSTWYVEDDETGKQESLRTKDRSEAERLCVAKNDALKTPMLNLALGRTYLAAHNPKLITRSWSDVMSEAAGIGRAESSLTRKAKAVKSKALDLIRDKRLSQTTSDDIFAVIRAGGMYDNRFLRYLHNFAVKSGWLPWPILAPKAWPAVSSKPKRGITLDEHDKILKVEPNEEWRNYLRLLWEVGSAQTDAAMLTAEQIDWDAKTLAYQRRKLHSQAEPAVMSIGPAWKRSCVSCRSPVLCSPGSARCRRRAVPRTLRSAVGQPRSSIGRRSPSLPCTATAMLGPSAARKRDIRSDGRRPLWAIRVLPCITVTQKRQR